MPDSATPIRLFEERPEPKTYRLSDLLGSVRRALEHDFRGNYRIVAELANITSARTGHYYLELTEMDKSGQKVATARANLWKSIAPQVMNRFARVTGGYPKVGMELLMTVRVTFSELYGFSLNILDIDPEHTLGNLERIRRETIKRLEAAGLLGLNEKQCHLPSLVQRIAVISSETAAGWDDFLDQMKRSSVGHLFRIELFPALMQGTSTTATVIAALDKVAGRADDFDVVVILRGGGSPLDLAAFDDYRLCEYIARFSLPVITAIGHERDYTVADYVAHTRVKTPTAAAELLIHRLEGEVNRLVTAEDRLERLLTDRCHRMATDLTDLPTRLARLLAALERSQRDRMARCERRLLAALHDREKALRMRMEGQRRRAATLLYDEKTLLGNRSTTLDSQRKRLVTLLRRLVPDRLEKLDHYARLAELYNPEETMRRGFLPVMQCGRQLTSVAAVKADEPLTILMSDGTLVAAVRNIIHDNETNHTTP